MIGAIITIGLGSFSESRYVLTIGLGDLGVATVTGCVAAVGVYQSGAITLQAGCC